MCPKGPGGEDEPAVDEERAWALLLRVRRRPSVRVGASSNCDCQLGESLSCDRLREGLAGV